MLFLDIADFTAISERFRPNLLVDTLNDYLGVFTDIVIKWNGMVDKYMGDAVMAVWGVPLAQEDHAQLACGAALEMSEAVRAMAKKNGQIESLKLRIRIGINSGKMIAGNVGAKSFFNYTVLGKNVNIASRLEGVNKVYRTVITIGQATAELVKDDFVLRELDFIRVKGMDQPLWIYELQSNRKSPDTSQTRINQLFSSGRDLYQAGNWAAAREYFEKGLALDKNEGPCRAYVARCLSFEEHPPGPTWDGIYTVKDK